MSEHLAGDGEAIFHRGVRAARGRDRLEAGGGTYRAGAAGDWMKSKCLREQEFVIGGFTFPSDGEDRVGSLLLGYYRDAAS